MDVITSAPTLGDYWGIDVLSVAQTPPTTLPMQRVSNAATIEISEVGLCLGLELGTEGGMGDAAIHFEIWSDTTLGCAGGAPHCPDQKLGDDSDAFLVDGLALMSGSPNGPCGTPGNGQEVILTWSGTKPNPTGDFWIVGVNNSPDGIATGQVRWGASASGITNTHADTDFDAWKATDKDEDFYFIVRVQP
jgi:hypothetical protein